MNNENLPRGLRVNNPLNIRKSTTTWQGEIKPSKDSSFSEFQSLDYGIRAAIKLLRTYMTKHKLTTIEGIVKRWAPPIENNTTAYINAISKHTGIAKNAQIVTKTQLASIAFAMAFHEQGVQVSTLSNFQKITSNVWI